VTILGPTATTVVEVTGADRADYLEAVTTQRLADARPGDVLGAMYLDPHGTPLAVFDVVVCDDRLLLLVPDPVLADEVMRVLGGRTFLSDATFRRTDHVVRSLRGDRTAEVVAAAGLDRLTAERRATELDEVVVVGRPEGLDLAGSTVAVDSLADRLVAAGAEAVDAAGLAAWRVAAGEPAWGREIAAPHLPEELGLLPTHVHLDKGCYPGQEAVARMWMLGRPRRRLARVAVDDGVEPGWTGGTGRDRVEVTAVTGSDGERVGLAFVPAGAVPGDRLAGDDGRGVTVRGLVGEDLPVPGHDPAVPRRRDRR
jgi:folate-binding protein YgfZ